MKKKLLTLTAIALGLLGNVQAQGYYTLQSKGVKDANYNYKFSLATGNNAVKLIEPTKDNVFSADQTLPFAWNFFGKPVTSYKVSDNGFMTFNTSETINTGAGMALPNANAPKNAIFAFWYDFKLASGGGVPDQVVSFTYGTAPNRVHVIQWLSVTNLAASYASAAIMIYEGKQFDVVLNQIGSPIVGTIGVNNEDGTVGYSVPGSPAYAWSTPSADDAYADMNVFKFRPAPQPQNDIEITSLNLPKFEKKNENISIKGKITNFGSQSLSSFRLHYAINGDVKSMLLSGLNVAGSGAGTYDFTHNIPFSSSTPGDFNIDVWASNPNAGADGDSSNNNAKGTLTIVNSTVPRMVLHEIFTSSTCPPCAPGNTNLKNVLDQNKAKWNLIKYQTNFPGSGDPYYTAEVGTRFSYYGAGFAPWLTVDGNSTWGASANSNSYTTANFSSASAIPSLATISANLVRSGKTVTVSGNVTPVQPFSNTNLKLRVAVLETRTTKNIKNNGETEFFNVFKKMLPSAAGAPISLTAGTAVPYTQSFTFAGNYRLPADAQATNLINLATEHSVEEFGNLFAVVFLQDDNDKIVWQSASTAPNGGVSVAEIDELGLSVYPNPATTSFEVNFTGSSSNAAVRILDMNGREVLKQDINSLNNTIQCEQLINGLYFVELTVNGKTAVKKMNIVR
jgi:hypothetical protein